MSSSDRPSAYLVVVGSLFWLGVITIPLGVIIYWNTDPFPSVLMAIALALILVAVFAQLICVVSFLGSIIEERRRDPPQSAVK